MASGARLELQTVTQPSVVATVLSVTAGVLEGIDQRPHPVRRHGKAGRCL